MLSKLLVDSLKRDAYVMEANAYESPEISSSDVGLSKVFLKLYEQLKDQLGDPLTAVLAIDSYNPSTKKDEALVICRTSEAAGGEHRRRTESPRKKRLNEFAKAEEPAPHVLEFASEVCEQVGSLPKVTSRQRMILAPYLVRSTDVPPTKHNFSVQLEEWESGVDDFMFTRPFDPQNALAPPKFADAYYAAVLLLISPKLLKDDPSHLDWVEALHVMFQLSWGFPTLGSTQKTITDMKAQATKLWEQQRELRRTSNIMAAIQKPAMELAAQVRKLEAAAGAIQRVLAPAHHSIFLDLRRAAIFFEEPRDIPVEVDSGLSINRAHGWNDPNSQVPLLVPAILTRILDLHGNGYFREDNLIDHANHLIIHNLDLRPNYARTAIALQKILGLHKDDSVGNVSEERFEILKHICHRPFKQAGFGFDANLCYGFFDGIIQVPSSNRRTPCLIYPPSPPELFLQGCRSFLEPKVRWSKAKGMLEVDFSKAKDHQPWLELKFDGAEGSFDPVDANKLRKLIVHASGGVSEQAEDLDGARTHLWDWATRPLTAHISEATHSGDMLGAFLLILGDLASETKLRGDDPDQAIFEARGDGVQVTIKASRNQRSVKIEHVDQLFDQA